MHRIIYIHFQCDCNSYTMMLLIILKSGHASFQNSTLISMINTTASVEEHNCKWVQYCGMINYANPATTCWLMNWCVASYTRSYRAYMAPQISEVISIKAENVVLILIQTLMQSLQEERVRARVRRLLSKEQVMLK